MQRLPVTRTLPETSNSSKLSSLESSDLSMVTTRPHTSKMISSLCWESLQQRRTDARLVMIYLITHDPADIPAAQYFRTATVSPLAVKTNATCYHSVELMCNHCSQLESVFGINCQSMLQQPGSWKPSRWA